MGSHDAQAGRRWCAGCMGLLQGQHLWRVGACCEARCDARAGRRQGARCLGRAPRVSTSCCAGWRAAGRGRQGARPQHQAPGSGACRECGCGAQAGGRQRARCMGHARAGQSLPCGWPGLAGGQHPVAGHAARLPRHRWVCRPLSPGVRSLDSPVVHPCGGASLYGVRSSQTVDTSCGGGGPLCSGLAFSGSPLVQPLPGGSEMLPRSAPPKGPARASWQRWVGRRRPGALHPASGVLGLHGARSTPMSWAQAGRCPHAACCHPWMAGRAEPEPAAQLRC